MGGWWLGGTHMKPNTAFLSEVQVSTRLFRLLHIALWSSAVAVGDWAHVVQWLGAPTRTPVTPT